MQPFNEPPVNPDEDTSPSLAMRPITAPEIVPEQLRHRNPVQRWIGLLSMTGALVFTVAAIALLLLPSDAAPVVPEPSESDAQPTTEVLPTNTVEIPTETAVVEAVTDTPPETVAGLPTISADMVAELLQTPVYTVPISYGTGTQYDPFTFIPGDRPRSEFLEYTAESGDTISEIAGRYGLASETIAWCNDRRIILVLRPGDGVRIPPVDGACYRILGTRNETITDIAEKFNVEVNDILNSPYDTLYDLTPESTLPGGKFLFIPGGEGEPITWNPGRDVEEDANGNIISVSFAPGQSGSCGAVAPGGGAYWSNPLSNAKWVRGFFAGHTGIDLSAPMGTPVYAANTGPVLFSGFSRWGYGETVVLAHGIWSTLYGHLSQRNAGCGAVASVGTVIGLVGSTGNSSGPHLHFEIRVNDQPVNPSGTPGIGW